MSRRTLKLVGQALLVLIAAIPCFGFTARGALASAGALSISPAQRTIVGVPPMPLTPGVIDNTTPIRFRVVVYPVLLHQQKLGSYSFSLASRQAAARIVEVTPSSFVLGSKQAKQVSVHWRATGTHPQAAYIGLLYRAVPIDRAGPVRTIEQLLNVNLLSVPGTRPAVPKLGALSVEQLTKRTLQFTAAVKNTGSTASSPDIVALTIRRSGSSARKGLPVFTGPVLPSATRDFSADLSRRLRGGRYTLSARVVMSGRTVSENRSFTVNASGQLAQARITTDAITASGAAGSSAIVSVPLANVGTAAARPAVRISLHKLVGGIASPKVVATKMVYSRAIPAGGHEVLSSKLGRLSSDDYEAQVQYLWPSAPSQSATVDFDTLTLPSARPVDGNGSTDLIPALIAALIASLGLGAGLTHRHFRT